MPKRPASEGALDPLDVSFSLETSSSGRPGELARKPKVTGSRLTLTHMPTGITVDGEVPEGHYAKNEMRREREALKQALLVELARRVAKHLRSRPR